MQIYHVDRDMRSYLSTIKITTWIRKRLEFIQMEDYHVDTQNIFPYPCAWKFPMLWIAKLVSNWTGKFTHCGQGKGRLLIHLRNFALKISYSVYCCGGQRV